MPKTSKTQEQRIDDAHAVMRGRIGTAVSRETARLVIEAADRETPNWPTDASLWAYGAAEKDREIERRGLRAAMLADPIIKAAIAYRDACKSPSHGRGGRSNVCSAGLRIRAAVNEAGL